MCIDMRKKRYTDIFRKKLGDKCKLAYRGTLKGKNAENPQELWQDLLCAQTNRDLDCALILKVDVCFCDLAEPKFFYHC